MIPTQIPTLIPTLRRGFLFNGLCEDQSHDLTGRR
jgi:hypothetical protein